MSSLPWHEAFYKLLNHAAELLLSSDAGELERFLDACYNAQVRMSTLMRRQTADNYQSISGSLGRRALPRVVELPTVVAGGRPNVSEEEGLFLSDSDIARASVDT